MSNDMKLIMESWRANLLEEQLLLERSAQEILDLAGQAEEALKNTKDEITRKKILARVFTGVAGAGIALSLTPLLAPLLATAGAKVGTIKLFSTIASGGLGKFFLSLSEPTQEYVMDQIPSLGDKLEELSGNFVTNILNLPDEEAAKNEYMRALDLPDKLGDMLKPEIQEKIIEKIKARLIRISQSGGQIDGTTMDLASKYLRHTFQLDIADPRIKK